MLNDVIFITSRIFIILKLIFSPEILKKFSSVILIYQEYIVLVMPLQQGVLSTYANVGMND
jgi:hypothetical protein